MSFSWTKPLAIFLIPFIWVNYLGAQTPEVQEVIGSGLSQNTHRYILDPDKKLTVLELGQLLQKIIVTKNLSGERLPLPKFLEKLRAEMGDDGKNLGFVIDA